MSEFSDRPFVAGSLTGLRAFDVDNLGRLVGPVYGQVFRPGENVAECRKHDDSRGGMTFTHSHPMVWFTPAQPQPPSPSLIQRMLGTSEPVLDEPRLAEAAVEKPDPPKYEHTIGGISCGCGFYAYFDGCNDYSVNKPERVAAIIEGYGVCTVGARGFRASKARLVALVAPNFDFDAPRVARVARNYGGVPVYADQAEAIAAHPLSEGELPTPSDADFWTRDPR